MEMYATYTILSFVAFHFFFFNPFYTIFIVHGRPLSTVGDLVENITEYKNYIVHVQKPKGTKFRIFRDRKDWYMSFLPNTTLDSGEPRMLYAYRHAINGFAARLTKAEVEAMEAKEGFLLARQSRECQLRTTYSPEFLGLSRSGDGMWYDSGYGESQIIAVLDSGIKYDHPSFDAQGMPPPPLTWKGSCYWSQNACNNKLIGAIGFHDGKIVSPLDPYGHGTHTASTAAGNFVDDAEVLGKAKGTASGMAPRAHIAAYKVTSPGTLQDAIKGIDKAIEDQVHVLSMSIGPPSSKPLALYDDDIAIGSFAAMTTGIVPCQAAGNAGPWPSFIDAAPWILTVGASTTDRRLRVIVKLGDGREFYGESAYHPGNFIDKQLPLVYPVGCDGKSLNSADVKGKIVICGSGMRDYTENVEKGELVKKAGGEAMIILSQANQGNRTDAEPHVIPASRVTYTDAEEILEYYRPNLSRNSSCWSAGSFESVKSEGFQFVFGSGVERNDGSSRESSLGSDEGLVFSKLPDRMRKMDLKSSGSGDDFEKARQVENGFVFGGGSVNGGNSGAGYVVFGGDVKKSVDLSWNSSVGLDKGSFFKLSDEMRKLNLKNSSNVNDSDKKQAENGFVFRGSMNVPGSTSSVSGSQPINVGSEKPKTRSVSFDSVGSGNSDEGVFTFGGGTNKSADAREKGPISKLPEEMRKLNLKNYGNADDFKKNKQAENDFIFLGSKTGSRSTGSISGSQPINVGSEEPNTCSVSVGSGDSGNSDEGVFLFGSGLNKRADASGLEKGSFSKLPDEMRKLNLKNSVNVDDFEKNKQAANVFVFGDSESLSVSASRPINVGSEKPNTHSSNFGIEVCRNSDEGVFIFGKLPDEIDNVDDPEKNKQAENVFVSGGSKTSSGSSSGSNASKIPLSAEFVSFHSAASGSKPINIGSKKSSVVSFCFSSEESGNSDASTFVLGSGGKRTVDLCRNSSLGPDEGLFFKHPDEMMNLTHGDGFEKLKTADNGIRSGGDRDATGSFGCVVANKVPEETGKWNVGVETATKSMKNESVGSSTGPFVFGSSTEKCSVSGFDNGPTFNLPTDKMSSTQGHEKDKEMGHKGKVDGGNSFIFGTSENTSASLGGSPGNIGTNTEKIAGNVPFECAFQVGKQDDRSNMTSIPPSPAPMFQSLGPTFSFTGKPVGLETPHMEFKTPKQYAVPLTKETLFTGTCLNMPFSAKKSDARKTRTKKKKGKPRQLGPLYQNFAAQFASEECDPQENPEVDSTEGYSPMDYSPYHEELVTDQHSREPSVASEDSIHVFSRGVSTDTQKSVSGYEQEEVLVSEAQRLNLSEGTCQGVGDNGLEDPVKRNANAESIFLDERTDKFENGTDMTKYENVDPDNDARTSPMDAEAGFFSSNIERPARGSGSEFTFSSSLGDLGESSFKFAASPSVHSPLPAAKHTYRRKNRLKSGQNLSVSTANARVSLASPFPDLIPHISTSSLPDFVEQNNTSSVPQSEAERKTGKSKESNAMQEPTRSAADSVPVKETCEKWRFRGNQAYANGHLTKAEDYYTRGVNSVSLKEIPSSCIKPLSLCYSNRAATRMSLGKWREALNDCKMAVSLDPDFLKAQVRVANCHLALGEIGEALSHFKKCLQSEKDISSNQKYIIEASDGLQKAQQVADLTCQSAELLLRRTSNDASQALNMISEALSVSPHSESLLEMKAEALLVMRNYEDVIKLCEQTLDLAKQNSVVMEYDSQFENVRSSEFVESLSPRLWRWVLVAKSYFYLGKLEEALELFQKHEKAKPSVDKSSEASTSFAVMIRELLQLKTAGNEAFQAGRHLEAVECYSSALACNAESRPFAAVCFCNRAAAFQALGQITDAIADCSHAIALDPSYAKAISRRATLHELIRDYGQGANDLNRLISLLQKQMQEKDNDSRGVGRSSSNVPDLKRARARLATVEEEARKGLSLNMYMILGIEPSSSSADVKKAYRKAALRHHPDKAGQFLVRNENVDDGLWREVAAEVRADADRLFKMIGEAYTTLSDPTKRLQYDEEEEMRTCPIRGYNVSSPKTSPHYTYSSHHEKSFNRHQWRSHGSSYHRW